MVVLPRLVFSLPPDSRRLSSNIKVSPCFSAYVKLDTDRFPFAPRFNPIQTGTNLDGLYDLLCQQPRLAKRIFNL